MSFCKSRSTKSTAETKSSKTLEPITFVDPTPAPAPTPEPQAREAAPWPLLCPTPDCSEHLRAHPHPSAPVLFAACGHSHCGLCAAVVLREPLPQCPTCGVGVGAGQASPNTGLGLYGEALLHAAEPTPVSAGAGSMPAELLCMACKTVDGVTQPATYLCSCGDCESRPLCCDHSRFHAKKTGHTPLCLEGPPAGAAGVCECAVHALPLSHYCMLHSEPLCSTCIAEKHLPCATVHVKTVQDASSHFAPVLSAAVTTFNDSANGMLHGISAIIAAKADMASRLQSSLSRFSECIDAVIAALHAHSSRVTTAANLQCAEYRKSLDSQAEVTSVSASQLQAAVAMAARALTSCNPVRILEAHATVKSMAALVKHYDGPVVVPVVEVQCDSDAVLSKLGELSRLVTGCGLKVASVSGLELQPGGRQEFRVELSLEDGSAPSWLTDSDVECTVQAACANGVSFSASSIGDVAVPAASAVAVSGVGPVRVLSLRAGPAGDVVIAYELVSYAEEVAIQLLLKVCGVRVGPAGGWRVRHHQTALSCMAVGTHVCTLRVADGARIGLAVSADEKWLLVGLFDACTLSVYSLPDGALVRTFGGSGSGPLQFRELFRLCVAPNSNLLVVDCGNCRLQEVTLEGVFIRFIGEGVWVTGVGKPWSVAVRNDIIAVGSAAGTGPRVTLLGFSSGAVTSRFGAVGIALGQLSPYCEGIRFTADGSHLVVVERDAKRLSLFTVGGVFVKCIGAGLLSGVNNDVCMSAKGEYVVADRLHHRVCVFSADGSELVRSWGKNGTGIGEFEEPTALAIVGAHLYVLDRNSDRVQVFD